MYGCARWLSDVAICRYLTIPSPSAHRNISPAAARTAVVSSPRATSGIKPKSTPPPCPADPPADRFAYNSGIWREDRIRPHHLWGNHELDSVCGDARAARDARAGHAGLG